MYLLSLHYVLEESFTCKPYKTNVFLAVSKKEEVSFHNSFGRWQCGTSLLPSTLCSIKSRCCPKAPAAVINKVARHENQSEMLRDTEVHQNMGEEQQNSKSGYSEELLIWLFQSSVCSTLV